MRRPPVYGRRVIVAPWALNSGCASLLAAALVVAAAVTLLPGSAAAGFVIMACAVLLGSGRWPRIPRRRGRSRPDTRDS